MAVTWFRKLEEAIQFAETASELCIFSHEFATNGARKFVVGLLPDLWKLLLRTSFTERTFYEIIQDTKRCRYYLDIEMLNNFNPCTNLEDIVEQIILIHERKYGKYDCIMLDSSSSIKSSYHIIWPDHIFSTKKEIKTAVLDTYGLCLDINVSDKHGNKVSCIDGSVYSRRQNFRTYLSVKRGKNVPLQKHTFTSASSLGSSEYVFFASSLICVPDMIIAQSIIETPQPKQSRSVTITNHRDINHFPNLLTVQNTMRTLHEQLDLLNLSSFDYYSASNILVIRSQNQQHCLTANRSHSTNNIYFVHYISSPAIQQRCQSESCKRAAVHHGWPLLTIPIALEESLQNLTRSSRSTVCSLSVGAILPRV